MQINKINPLSYKSKIKMNPQTAKNLRNLDCSTREKIITQLEQLESNGNKDTIFISSYDGIKIGVEVAKKIKGVLHTATADVMPIVSTENGIITKWNVANIIQSYNILREMLLPEEGKNVLNKFIEV